MTITLARLRNSIAGRWQKYVTRPVRKLHQLATRRGRVARYLSETAVPALILGAGPQRRAGWLATDLQPEDSNVVYVDAAKRLPFADNSFAYVFAEHMIEHVSHATGVRLAAEIMRVLKPGGVFRVATPDLTAIARLALPSPDAAAIKYIDASNGLFGHSANRASFVVNRVFRWWGHQFIYDEETLRDVLLGAGFDTVTRRAVGASDHALLRDLENHGDVVGREMNAYETMVLEAAKRSPRVLP